MIKVVAPLLTVFLVLGLVGCDLSMNKNKNKNTAKEETNKNALVQTPLEEQQPIHIDDVVNESSPQTKQAEKWQQMNLATSTNDQGNTIEFDSKSNLTTEPQHHSTEPSIEDYFADYKPNK